MKSSCLLSVACALAVALVMTSAQPACATAEQRIDFPLRGKTLTISVYKAALAQPLGTILMGSGDVGWVGLAVDMSEYLSDKG
jgi:hypothetical protein